VNGGQIYADLTVPIGDKIEIEGGVHAVSLQGGSLDVARLDPRIGIGFEPVAGQWLRAAYRRDTDFPVDFTLSPVTTLGLTPTLAPLQTGGQSESAIVRWDAEWTAHVFTSVEYLHQELDGLSLPIPQAIDTLDLAEGRVDRITGTTNVWIGGGFGVFATASQTDGKASDPTLRYSGDMPFLPDNFGRAGITWVSPARIKVTLAQTYVGERLGVRQSAIGPISGELDAFTTTDILVNWEPFDRRFAFDASIINLFDRDFDVAPAVVNANGAVVAPAVNGPGRTVLASMKVRF
jgi:hypothetical protein